jgi:NADH-quinone oxidoreductase subunit L
MTHAFFKALLFLAAGSVIMGMHHDQDIRNMGGLRKYMPVTWITSLIGSLALIGAPFFSGFYSKDSILIAAQHANVPGAGFAYFAVTAGVLVTAFYSFRMYFLVFHGKERFDVHAHDAHHHGHHDDHGEHHGGPPHESPAVVWVPLVLLAIPSAVIGYVAIEPMLFGDFFKGAIAVDGAAHPAMAELTKFFTGATAMGLHGFVTLPFFLDVIGVGLAAYLYLFRPDLAEALKNRFAALYRLLDNKYYLDRFNEIVFAAGSRLIGRGLWKGGDQALIDGIAVNGSARLVGWFSGVVRLVQTGYIYHYAFAMLLGIAVVLFLFLTVPYLWPQFMAR